MRAQSKIGLKTIRATVAPVSIILVVAVATTAFVSYRLSLARLQQKVERLGTEHRSSIEGMLWQFDVRGLERQLQGFVSQDDVRWASVAETAGNVLEAGRRAAGESAAEHTVRLNHRDGRGDVEHLGTLAEGNFVLAQNVGLRNGEAVKFWDLLRLENGKFVEHWDIVSPIELPVAWRSDPKLRKLIERGERRRQRKGR